ncbi:MAG: hypothetical protein WD044_11280 [Dongiaceae bacterium]
MRIETANGSWSLTPDDVSSIELTDVHSGTGVLRINFSERGTQAFSALIDGQFGAFGRVYFGNVLYAESQIQIGGVSPGMALPDVEQVYFHRLKDCLS